MIRFTAVEESMVSGTGGSAARAQAGNKAYQLPSARTHLLKVPGLPKTVPPAGEEGVLHIQNMTPISGRRCINNRHFQAPCC